MTDIVIPYRNDYPHKDLIYCLRSLERNMQGFGRLIIVGECPPIIRPDLQILCRDDSGYKWASRNIYRKIKEAAQASDKFLVVHDDHFQLTPILPEFYPYYRRGPLNPEGKPQGYAALLQNTLDQFPGANDFDVHCPILMTAEGLAKLDQLDWSKPYGYGIKTAYCVLNDIEGVQFADLKIKSPMTKDEILKLLEGRNVFSTGSAAYTGQIEKALKHLFPKASKYEHLNIHA